MDNVDKDVGHIVLEDNKNTYFDFNLVFSDVDDDDMHDDSDFDEEKGDMEKE